MAKSAIKARTNFNIRLESKINDSSYVLKAEYYKRIDDEKFLITVPAQDGKPQTIQESDKLYMNYNIGGEINELEGYADGYVKKGSKIYLKVRKTMGETKFDQRVSIRIKVAIKAKWDKLDKSGKNGDSSGTTMDISGGGVSMYMDTRLNSGEKVELHFPKIKGSKEFTVKGEVCWITSTKDSDKQKFLAGFRFLPENNQVQQIADYVQAVSEIMED